MFGSQREAQKLLMENRTRLVRKKFTNNACSFENVVESPVNRDGILNRRSLRWLIIVLRGIPYFSLSELFVLESKHTVRFGCAKLFLEPYFFVISWHLFWKKTSISLRKKVKSLLFKTHNFSLFIYRILLDLLYSRCKKERLDHRYKSMG